MDWGGWTDPKEESRVEVSPILKVIFFLWGAVAAALFVNYFIQLLF